MPEGKKFTNKNNRSSLADMPIDAFISGKIRYQSENNTDLQNPTRILAGYSITNLGLGIKDKSKNYTLTLNINNLFNRHYSYFNSTQFGQFVAADKTT